MLITNNFNIRNFSNLKQNLNQYKNNNLFKPQKDTVSFTSNSITLKLNSPNIDRPAIKLSKEEKTMEVLKEAALERKKANILIKRAMEGKTFPASSKTVVAPQVGIIYSGIDAVNLSPIERKIDYDPTTGELKRITRNYYKTGNYESAEKIFEYSSGKLVNYIEDFRVVNDKKHLKTRIYTKNLY